MMQRKINTFVGLWPLLGAFLFSFSLEAGEYTNTFRLKVNQMGESEKSDPVEAFNSAIEYATQTAETAGEGVIRQRSASLDSVLEESWIQKEAHLQVIDLKVLNYRFFRPGDLPGTESKMATNSLLTQVNIDVTMEYLDVPRFMEDYEKTVTGAVYRSMAIPGWGQIYNKQLTTGILYGLSFWTFYLLYIQASQAAGSDQAAISDAFLKLQIPAMVLWIFNASEAGTSRYLGHLGLENLRKAYHLTDYKPVYESRAERGFKLDFLFFQVPLY